MLRTSVKKAVGRITAGVAAVILVAGGGAGFVGQTAWGEGVVGDDWVVDGGTKGTDWDTDDTGTLTIKKPGEYTVERTGDSVCRIHFAEKFDTRTTLTLGNVNCEKNETGAGLDPNGSGVTLVLAGDARFGSFSDNPAVRAQGADEEHRLEITSIEGEGSTEGSLTAKNVDRSAGIGGGEGDTGSYIKIIGGTVTARGGERGAGIGGGAEGGAGSHITITGGSVTAYGGLQGGAGIGGGQGGAGSDITITGGVVTTTGLDGGAGIGGGTGGAGSNIRISGGHVTASGYGSGAGIGGGDYGPGSDIRISGGHVTASTDGFGAGIGGGDYGPGSDITILGGVVTATGGEGGTGIGGGEGFYAHNVAISGGTVTATGGCNDYYGCGLDIGHGSLKGGVSDEDPVDQVEITGGSVKTTGAGEVAQIGGITDKENPTQALFTLPAQWVTEKNQITIDGLPWKRLGAHPENDWAWYAWLSKEPHILTVGGVTCKVGWVDTSFDTSACAAPTPVSDPGKPPVGTPSSVTVNISNAEEFGGAEYSFDEGKNWQTSNTFSNLAAGTAYHVWARYTGDATYFPSEPLVVDVQTAPKIVPPTVLTSPIYSGQKVGDLKLSDGWDWGFWEYDHVGWSPSADNLETFGNIFGRSKVISAPAGQHFSYSDQDLPTDNTGSPCEFSGPSTGAAVTVRCNVEFTVSRAPNEWTTPVDITDWDFEQEPNSPVGEATYGEVKFSYLGTLTDGSTYGPTDKVPTRAGRYTLTATVDKGAKDVGVRTGQGPGMDRNYYLRYQGLSATKEFEIRQAGNGWVTVPSIARWTFGQTPSVPQGEAEHGDVVFSYRSVGDPSADFVPWDDGPSAAGDYELRAVVKDPDYGDLEKIVSFSVDRADAVFSQPVAKPGLVYSATGQELVSGGVSEHGSFEYSLNGSDWSSTVPSGVEAGQYQVRWQFVPDGNHTAGQGASRVVTVDIAAAKPTVTAESSRVISFGQGFADAGVTVNAVFDGKAVAGSTEWFDTDQELTAGTHKFTGTFTPTDTKNFESVSVTVRVQVDAVAAVFFQPVAKAGLVYSAKGQELVSGGVSGHGMFEYSLDGERWDAAVPVGVEAGEYQVLWRFVPDGNHTAGQGASGVVTVGIAAVKPTVTAKPSGSILFGQGFADAGVTVDAEFNGTPVAGTTQWDGADRELTVGSHEFTGRFTPTDTKNFESVSVTVSVQVDAVSAVVTGLEAVKNLVFTDSPQALVTSSTVVGGAVEYAVGSARPADDSTSWSAEVPEATDAGDYMVFWRVVPDGNHTAVGGDVQVAVAAAEPTVSAQPARVISFGQRFVDAGVTVASVFGGKPVEGATQWADTDRELTAGTHKFTGTFTPTDTKNFTPVSVTVTVQVDPVPAVVSGLEAVKDLVYTGSPQVLVTAPTVTGGTVEYAVGSIRPADDSQSWSQELPKVTDAGDYTVFWRVVPDGNHTSVGGDVQVKVAAAQPTVTAQPARAITFGQRFADAGVTVSAEFGGKPVEGTTQWTGTDRELTLGTHEFTGTFTPKDTKNFTPVPVTVTVQVGKAPATVTGLEAVGNLVFNGQLQALVTTPTVVGGTIEYAVGESEPSSPEAWESTLPVGSHAGSATVFWRVVPDGNHTEVHGQVAVVIAPKVAAADGQLASGFSFSAEQGEYVIWDGQTRLRVGPDYRLELVNASFESQTADVEITFEGDYTGFAVVKNAMATEWGGASPVEWKPGSDSPTFDLGEGASPVSGVQVDDKPLSEGMFRLEDGKLVVDSAFLDGLAPGDHTLEVRLEDGSVIVYPIRVLPADKPAPLFTGEWLAWLLTWPILLWMVLRTFAPWLLPFFLK